MFSVQTMTNPTLLVSVEDLKAHLRIEYDDEDALLERYIRVAQSNAEKITRSRLVEQTVEITMDGFEYDELVFHDVSPVRSVTSVNYIDDCGEAKVLDLTKYRLIPGLPSKLVPVARGRFPWVTTKGSVTVSAVVGYVTCPPEIVQWIMLRAGDMYQNREASGDQQFKPHDFVDALLETHRVFS